MSRIRTATPVALVALALAAGVLTGCGGGSSAGHPSADKLLVFTNAQIAKGGMIGPRVVDKLYAPHTGSKGYPGVVNKEHPAPILWTGKPTWEVAVAGVQGYMPADTPEGQTRTAFSQHAIIVEDNGVCSYIDADGPSVVALNPCPAEWKSPFGS